MSKIDYQALREVTEKATPGNWWIDSHGNAMVSFIDNEVLEVFATDNKRDAVRHEDTGNLSRWRNDNDATFIATANPATVLALLDELEASQSENERLAKTLIERNGEPVEGLVKRVAELEEIATDYGMKFQRAQDALKHQSLLHKSQMEAAEKRIAELDARQVDLEHIGYIQVEEGAFYLDEGMVKSAICAAGIRINGED